MTAHQHEWQLQAHLDRCHFMQGHYVCACGASAVETQERDFREPCDAPWADEACERCRELLAGEPRFCHDLAIAVPRFQS